MTLALTVFKKSTFQKISHLNAFGSNIDLDIKQVKVNLGSTWRRFFKRFLPYMGVAAILVM